MTAARVSVDLEALLVVRRLLDEYEELWRGALPRRLQDSPLVCPLDFD